MKWVDIDYKNLPPEQTSPYFVKMVGKFSYGTLWPEYFERWGARQYLDESADADYHRTIEEKKVLEVTVERMGETILKQNREIERLKGLIIRVLNMTSLMASQKKEFLSDNNLKTP